MKKTALRITRRPDGEASVDLTKLRAWFVDGDGQQSDGEKPGQSSGSDKTPIDKLPTDIQEYIKSLRSEAATARTERAALQQQLVDKAEAQRKQLEQDGKHEQLANQYAVEIEQLKPQAEYAKELEQIIRDGNEELIKTIPEVMRSLVPDLPPKSLQKWLMTNAPKLKMPPPPNYDGGASGNGAGGATVKLTAEEKEMARLANMTEEQYLKAKQKTGR